MQNHARRFLYALFCIIMQILCKYAKRKYVRTKRKAM
nr:MAG TPA: hypothetical protein [Caudoviricetes sp.]